MVECGSDIALKSHASKFRSFPTNSDRGLLRGTVLIHMLSRFDLTSNVSIEDIQSKYMDLVEAMVSIDLAIGSGSIGRRVLETPMDTDDQDAPEYFVVMTFRDRDQLNASYAYLADQNANPEHIRLHRAVLAAVKNPVFTCWETV